MCLEKNHHMHAALEPLQPSVLVLVACVVDLQDCELTPA